MQLTKVLTFLLVVATLSAFVESASEYCYESIPDSGAFDEDPDHQA